MRYALGTSATDQPHDRLPNLKSKAGQPHFRFPFDPALADLAYIAEASADLVDWSTVLFDSRVDTAPSTEDDWLSLPLESATPLHPLRFTNRQV